jgi:methyl-accepting chemotaxis protein
MSDATLATEPGAATAAPVRGLGLRARLYAAFGVAALLSVAACAVGWLSFDNVDHAMHRVAKQAVPAIANSLDLARLSAEVAAAAPSLAGVSSQQEREKVRAELSIKRAAMQAALEAQSGDASIIATLNAMADDMSKGLDALDKAVGDRLSLAARRGSATAEMRKAHEAFRQFITPLLDDISFEMTMALTSIGEKTGSGTADATLAVMGIADKELVILDSMFRMVADVNEAQGILAEASVAPAWEQLQPARERLTAAVARIRKHQTALKKVSDNAELTAKIDAVLRFAAGDHDLLNMRRAELDAQNAGQGVLTRSRETAQKLGETVGAIVTAARADTASATAAVGTEIGRGRWLLLGIAASSVLIAALVGWLYVGRRIANRLVALSGAMRRVAAGELDAPIPADGRDEIADMATALVVFRDAAQAQRAAEAEAADERERLSQERRTQRLQLADAFEASVKKVVDELIQGAGRLQETARVMSDSMAATEQRTGQVASVSSAAQSNVQAVAAATEELTASISSITSQVEQSTKVAGQAVHEAKETGAQVNGLAEAARRIGDVVSLISDIAGQTNLLALNATIEAARAGDAGRGFAVVASEVKNLAGQTAKATEEITAQVSAIQAATGQSVDAIQRITQTIAAVNEIAGSIAAAIEQQRAATQQIARNVHEAAGATADTTSNVDVVLRSANETGQRAGQVLAAAQAIAGQSDTLNAEVDGFLRKVRA